ncbi:hypothetical protein AX774_g5686 [Zancudomyces culisetae]|uniref:Uncharacterized protein n=1 Tax=Zancudomyces culisetae TaxID=1213189 RepID=A0A1R1PIU8_ZANCU|nr:hypothetical protein AX774_g5686 [Zancudomyces culisetae]|eukprot:OMH80868.1 hypothetical protein AX774_g5686 [Zancudomyces culisetae]
MYAKSIISVFTLLAVASAHPTYGNEGDVAPNGVEQAINLHAAAAAPAKTQKPEQVQSIADRSDQLLSLVVGVINPKSKRPDRNRLTRPPVPKPSKTSLKKREDHTEYEYITQYPM